MFLGGMLGGPHYRFPCPNCHRYLYLTRDMRNTVLPLAMLGVALIATFPSPISDQILSNAGRWTPIVRAVTWSTTTLVAFAIFVLGGQLTASPIDQPRPRITVRARVTNLVILILMLVWLYHIWRGLLDMS